MNRVVQSDAFQKSRGTFGFCFQTRENSQLRSLKARGERGRRARLSGRRGEILCAIWLMARGYRIVHVVPATSELPATPTEPQQWQLHPPSENEAISHWPKIPNFAFADADMLAAPALTDVALGDGQLMDLAQPFDRTRRRTRGVPLPQQAPWPRQWSLPLESAAFTLPVPAESLFEIPEKSFAAIAPSSHHGEQTAQDEHETSGRAKLVSADAGEIRHTIRGRSHIGRARQHNASKVAGHRNRIAAHARRGTLRHLVQVKKRSV